MNLPIQAQPVIRGVSTTKLKGENGLKAAVSTDCYSAKNCEGKILNHKDPHNCKNSGGKSCFYDGKCHTPCS
jgi:hypothetical protein